jgi:hypothetical protein
MALVNFTFEQRKCNVTSLTTTLPYRLSRRLCVGLCTVATFSSCVELRSLPDRPLFTLCTVPSTSLNRVAQSGYGLNNRAIEVRSAAEAKGFFL